MELVRVAVKMMHTHSFGTTPSATSASLAVNTGAMQIWRTAGNGVLQGPHLIFHRA